jgi:hypothetical protein
MSPSRKENAIVPLPAAPIVDADHPGDEDSQTIAASPGRWMAAIDRVLAVQRPAVIAHVAFIRRRNPDASPADLIRILERRYLAAVSAGGAAVGATAVIPAVGFATSLGLSGMETLGFLETTALFAQSVAEVHGVAVDDPERARTLVMAMMLGTPGTQLVKQLAGQAAGGPVRTAFWGDMVASSLPKQVVSGIGGQIRDRFIKRFAASQGASIVGRAMPFGIGAVVGGIGNHTLGRRVVQSSRSAFGLPPAHFPVVITTEPDVAPGEAQGRRMLPWGRRR